MEGKTRKRIHTEGDIQRGHTEGDTWTCLFYYKRDERIERDKRGQRNERDERNK